MGDNQNFRQSRRDHTLQCVFICVVVQVRGRDGLKKLLQCIYVNAIISAVGKHDGCYKDAPTDLNLPSKLSVSTCTEETDCIHAVISRHPMELKHGKHGAVRVWEAYYGAWARSNISNVHFYRYEDVVVRGCTANYADKALVREYFERKHPCVVAHDDWAWKFWNYTQASCVP